MTSTRHLCLALLFAAATCGGGDAEDSSTGADTTTGSSADDATGSSTDTTTDSTDSTSTSTTGADEDCGNGIPVPGVFCFELEFIDPSEELGASSFPIFVESEPGRGIIYFCDGPRAWAASTDFGQVTSVEPIDGVPLDSCEFIPSPTPGGALHLLVSYANERQLALAEFGPQAPALGEFVGPLLDKRSNRPYLINDDPYPDVLVDPLDLPGEFEVFYGDADLGLTAGPPIVTDEDIYWLRPIALDSEAFRSVSAIDRLTDEGVIFGIDPDLGLVERYRYEDEFSSPQFVSARFSGGTRPELVSIATNVQAGFLVVHLPVGEDDWEPQPRFKLPGSARHSYIGDFDGDGDLDLTVSSIATDDLYFVEFDGVTPVQTGAVALPEFVNGSLMTIADLNDDGVDDVLMWDRGNDQVVIFRSNP